MRRLIVMLLVIGINLIFFSCSGENPTEPEISQAPEISQVPEMSQMDQLTDPLPTECVTYFSGTSYPVAPINPGTTTVLPNGKTLLKGQVAEWYDNATDPRVTGQSIWTVNKLLDPDGTGIAWGNAELNVDNSGGKWKIVWWGCVSEVGVVAKAVGIGKKGAVRGLFAKWTYTMTFANGIFYVTEGYIH
jgi:hypothetical protein